MSNPESAPTLRTLEARTEDMESIGNSEDTMSSAGWKSWSHAFTRCRPYFDFLKNVPYDLMHVESEGLLKGELAHFLFYCVRNKEYFDLDKLNRGLPCWRCGYPRSPQSLN